MVIGSRCDFSYLRYKCYVQNYRYPTLYLRTLLKDKPQYGSNEAGITRNSNQVARYVRITDIEENGQLSIDLGVTAKHLEDKYFLNNNDILIARSGNTVGKSYIHKSSQITYPCFFAGYLIRFIIDETKRILSDFVFIFTQLPIFREWVKATQRTTGQPNINADEYGNLDVPIPPLDYQRQMVKIYNAAIKEKQEKEQEAKTLLESIDAYILNALKVNLPKPNLQSSLFSKVSIDKLIGKRFDPYYHKPYFEDAFAELGKSYYPIARLKDIAEFITSGITPKSGGDDYTTVNEGVAFIRSGDIDINGEIDFDDLLYIKKEVHNNKMKSSQVRNNDIMIAIVGATIGQVGIYHSDKEANINQAIALVRLKDGYNPEYVKEVIKSSIGQLNLNRLKRPVARANINLEENDIKISEHEEPYI